MKNFISILFLSVLFLTNCDKENLPEMKEEEMVEDNYQPPYTVRYEVKFSSNAVNYTPEISYAYEYPKGTWRIATAPGTRDYVSKSQLINGWTKEFKVTIDDNPLRIQCNFAYNPVEDATVNTKMYVNDVLVKDKTWNRSPSSSSTPTFHEDSYDVY